MRRFEPEFRVLPAGFVFNVLTHKVVDRHNRIVCYGTEENMGFVADELNDTSDIEEIMLRGA